MDGYDFKPKHPRAVTDYLKNKGLKPSFSWLDVWAEEHAFAFTVAKATQINVLTDIREELQRALDNGLPFSEFQKQLKPRLKARGWWGDQDVVDPKTGKKVKARLGSPRRLQTIYSANVRTARSAAQWERIQDNKDIQPYIIYKLGPSENHRPLHKDKENIILPADNPFWQAWFAPNGWGCKCHHRSLTGYEAKKLGYTGQPAPKIRTQKFKNKRTGKVTEIPEGIDPGWHTNPGFTRRKNTSAFLSESLENAPLDLARIAVNDLVRDEEFTQMLLAKRDYKDFPIAMLPDVFAKVLASKSKVVRLSKDTAARHNFEVGDYTKYPPPDYFVKIQEMLIKASKLKPYSTDIDTEILDPLKAYSPRVYLQPGGNLVIRFFDEFKTTHEFVVKVTKDATEIYLTTFYAAGRQRLKRQPQNSKRIR